MAGYRHKQGDTTPPLTVTLQHNTVPINLTGATVRFHMSPAIQGVGSVVNAPGVVLDAPAGRVRYMWAVSDVAAAGVHRAEFEVTFADGTVESFPNAEPFDVEITSAVA